MKIAGLADPPSSGAEADRDLLSALTGKQAGRDRAVAHRTRRVVMASLGVMQDQKAGRKRTRSLALASILLFVLAMGPFVWRVSDDIIGGEHWSDVATQASLWICMFFPALLAAALVAGWMRSRP
ncbi:MAG TPA: hypothetical protein VGF96_05285 [Terracidiphilus sp.]